MTSRLTAAGAFLAGFATLAWAIRPEGSSFGIPGKNATFDYIVIGGGNAGLTIAARLADGQSRRGRHVPRDGQWKSEPGTRVRQ